MPRPAKPPRLYARHHKGQESMWAIIDRGREHGTGCALEDRAGAEKALADYLAGKYAAPVSDGEPRSVSVSDILILYVKGHGATRRRADMANAAALRLSEFFDHKTVADVTPGACRAYSTWRKKQRQASYTKNPSAAPFVGDASVLRELGVLSAAIGYAYAEHKLKYLVPVWMPDATPSRTRYLTRSEFARLLWAAYRGEKSKHLARFLLVSFYTGSRKSAVLALQWMPNTMGGWVDLKAGLIYRKAVAQTETDKRRPPIAISRRLAAHLRRWCGNGRGPVVGYLSDGQDEAGGVQDVKRSFKTARKAAGLGEDVVIHTLRHTFASRAIINGASFSEVAESIGTSEAIVKRVYGHLASDYTRSTVEAVTLRRG